jgi:hypothetical protein
MNSPSIGFLARIKNSWPYSVRLNEFIRQKVENELKIEIQVVGESRDDWEQLKDSNPLKQTISTIGCGNTIFGDPQVNIMFRAWHDYIHITKQLDFSPINEAAVAFIQASELPWDWWYEKQLIIAEVVGQVVNHERTGQFNHDQRAFTLNLLATGTTDVNF